MFRLHLLYGQNFVPLWHKQVKLYLMNVKGLIRSRGFTLEKVAQQLGTSQSSLSQCLSGNPTVEKLKDIAEVIGCDLVDFFADERKNKTPFLAMVQSGDKHYEAFSLTELKEIVRELEK